MSKRRERLLDQLVSAQSTVEIKLIEAKFKLLEQNEQGEPDEPDEPDEQDN